jgi:pyrimidine-nucleoside phosphorylase
VLLGGGRDRVDDAVDPGVGIMIRATVGQPVRTGDAVLELRYRDAARVWAALGLAKSALEITPDPPDWADLIIEEVL